MSSKSFLSFLVACIIASATVPAHGVEPYTQTYIILIKGSVAGNERVTETPAEKGEILSTSEHEMLITDGLETKRMAFSTRMILSKASSRPVSYSYKYSGAAGDSYDVVIKDNQIRRTLRRGDRTNEVTAALQPDTVLVDFNVYHQYDYLVRKYDSRKGGRQLFSNFIPVIGNDIPVALTFLGDGDLDVGKGAVPVKKFKVEFVGLWAGSLSVDKDGRLVRLLIPAQDLEVIREDLVGSRQ
jgi:hypothetical protein